MKLNLKIVVLFGLSLLIGVKDCLAQNDSLYLQEVKVNADRYTQFNSGQKTVKIDSVQSFISTNHSLADVLTDQSQVFVKNYGPGNIATPSFRGTGAEHTAVLWNGFNLQSPMLGLTDISIIPFNSGDEIQIRYGGNGALYGSGAIGGAIHMNSSANFNSGLKTTLSFWGGSFSNFKQLATIRYGSGKWYTSLKLIHQQSENNFPFHNEYKTGSPLQNQTHAAIDQQALILENYFRFSNISSLNFRIWLQQTNRKIPPTMSIPVSNATQRDKTVRITSEWNRSSSKNRMSIRAGIFYDQIYYHDSLKNIQSLSHSLYHITEAENIHVVSQNVSYSFGLNNTFSAATADGYTNKLSNRFAQFTSLKFSSSDNKWKTSLSIRTELWNSSWNPVLPFIGTTWLISPSITLSGNISRAYRAPTFNEWYWTPSLKPESGWGEETSVEFHKSNQWHHASATLTGFNRLVTNWLMWVPDTTGLNWRPHNVPSVWNRGSEINFKWLITPNKKVSLRLQTAFNFVYSTTKITGIGITQLPYLPRITHQYQATITYKKSYLSYIHTYTGFRYASRDNSSALNDFQIGNLRAGMALLSGKNSMALTVECNNIWNTSYLVMPSIPMPLRNFLFGLTLTI